MDKIELRSQTIEDKEIKNRTLSGYAAVFDQWSNPLFGYFREKIDKRAFDGADFSECFANFNHDDNQILGSVSGNTLQLTTDERGLKFSLVLPETSTGEDIMKLVERGDISKCSFRFTIKEEKWGISGDKNLTEDRTLLKIDKVYDVAVVTRPAYPQTVVDVAARKEQIETEIKTQNWYYAEMMLGLK